MLPTFYLMVFDTRVSSEQTVKQQEHALQGVAQMVMNMETEYVVATAKANSDVSGYFRRMFCVCWKFSSKRQDVRTKTWSHYGSFEPLTDES